MSDFTCSQKTLPASAPQVYKIYIELSNICNFRCDFCPSTVSHRKRQHMDFHLFKKLVDEIAENNITDKLAFYVLGEPLLYPHLFDAIQYAKGRDLKVEITTNGSLLTGETVKGLIRLDVDVLIISVVTINADEHRFRNSRQTFDDYYRELLEALHLIKASCSGMRVELRMMTTYTKRFFNVETDVRIGDRKRVFKKDLLRFMEDVLSAIDERAPREKIKHALSKITLHQEQIIWIYRKIGLFLRPFVDWGNAFTTKKIVPCRIGYCSLAFNHMGVLSNGEAIICCGDYEGNTSLGNLHHASFSSLLASKKAKEIRDGFKRFRTVHPHCQKCLGASNHVKAFFKGMGSIYLFKFKSASKPRHRSVS